MDLSNKIIDFILDHEGSEYTNDPNDPGGETKWGISKKAFPDVDIPNLTKDTAANIYRKVYWNPLLDPKVAATVCDAAVNCGISRAISWLQLSINKCLRPPSNGVVDVDGKLGMQTIQASQRCDSMNLVLYINALRIKYYLGIGTGNLAKFLSGWLNRIADLQILISIGEKSNV